MFFFLAFLQSKINAEESDGKRVGKMQRKKKEKMNPQATLQGEMFGFDKFRLKKA